MDRQGTRRSQRRHANGKLTPISTPRGSPISLTPGSEAIITNTRATYPTVSTAALPVAEQSGRARAATPRGVNRSRVLASARGCFVAAPGAIDRLLLGELVGPKQNAPIGGSCPATQLGLSGSSSEGTDRHVAARDQMQQRRRHCCRSFSPTVSARRAGQGVRELASGAPPTLCLRRTRLG